MRRFLPIALLVAIPGTLVAQGARAANNRELQALFEADQADRHMPPPASDSAFMARARQVVARDSVRRRQVEGLMARGAARTAQDFYHAAMIAQHGMHSTDYRHAHDWSKRAIELDSTLIDARYLFAASFDRYQRSIGKPQWYGTQIIRRPGEPFTLYDVDTTRVTDAERKHYGVPTLAEQRERVRSMNAARP